MKKFLFLLLLFLNSSILANNNILNIYIWSDYIPRNVIRDFEKTTKIKVNVTEFDSNEDMYAKLKTAPNAGYDIVQPSSYFVARMRNEGMLTKLNKKKLTNFKNLNPALISKPFDPNNEYSIPYLWGSTGLVVNKNVADWPELKKIQSWTDLWKPQYNKLLKNRLLILDDIREAFGIAMITLGYSINDTNPDHIKSAYLKLKELMPRVRLFSADGEQSIYIDEDIDIGMGWSGDINLSQKENKNILYLYPKDGFALWMDCFAITKNAPHVENAHKFLNYMLRPEVAKEVSIARGYSTTNRAAMKLLPANIRNNKTIYPDQKTLQRGSFFLDLGKADTIYAKYWDLLKIGA